MDFKSYNKKLLGEERELMGPYMRHTCSSKAIFHGEVQLDLRIFLEKANSLQKHKKQKKKQTNTRTQLQLDLRFFFGKGKLIKKIIIIQK